MGITRLQKSYQTLVLNCFHLRLFIIVLLKPKFTVITACFQAEKTIGNTIQSVHTQSYKNLEHIIIDGGSTDRTLEIIKATPFKYQLLSEKDKGYYDALNKGLDLATGEWIGVLNADDVYKDRFSLEKLLEFLDTSDGDTCFADVEFVNKKGRIIRKASGQRFNLSWFAKGNMPPHPTFVAKRSLFEKLGKYRTDLRIAADFELIARFLWKDGCSWSYLPETVVTMRVGGMSNSGIKSKLLLNMEIRRACRDLGIKTSYFKIYSKYFSKWLQYLSKP